MKTFIIVVAGMFVGGILCLILLWFGIKFLIRHFVSKLANLIEKYSGQGVPPFRITLQKSDKLKWKHAKVADGVAKALEEAGYIRIGDFEFNELPSAHVRALVNPKTNTYGVIAEYSEKSIVLDIACDFENKEHVTVSTAPETGLDRPDFSRLIRVDADLAADPSAAATLHERIVAEQRGRRAVVATADAFPKMYAAAHAREMDWRIARGGVSAEEIRRSCEVTATEIPNDEAVEMVRKAWRNAISEFVNEQLREKFLKYITKMSAAEWEEVRDRLYFVHEHSEGDTLVEQLSWHVAAGDVASAPSTNGNGDGDDDDDDDDSQTEAAAEKLRPLFAGVPVREAFAKAQALLPPDRRYRRVAGIKTPYAADVYVEPQMADDRDE